MRRADVEHLGRVEQHQHAGARAEQVGALFNGEARDVVKRRSVGERTIDVDEPAQLVGPRVAGRGRLRCDHSSTTRPVGRISTSRPEIVGATARLEHAHRSTRALLAVYRQQQHVVREVAHRVLHRLAGDRVSGRLDDEDARYTARGEVLDERVEIVVQSLRIGGRAREISECVDDQPANPVLLDPTKHVDDDAVDLQLYRRGIHKV